MEELLIVLMAIIRRKIKCSRTLALLESIVFATGDRADPTSHDMPIGNLISQWGANLYLNELDQFVKHDLRARYFIRLMDDTLILHPDKRQLLAWQREIEHFLGSRLLLRPNNKTSIFPVAQGIDFLGYRTWLTGRLLRKSSAKRMISRLRYLARKYREGKVAISDVTQSVRSWVAHAVSADSWPFRARVLGSVVFSRPGGA